MTILLADDHFLILEGLQSSIQAQYPKAKILLAENKSVLFEKLQQNKIDVLIQDIKFGNDHASDFISEIVNNYPKTKVIVLSSISDASTIKKLHKKTNGYVLKTEPTDIIFKAIDAVLSDENYISPNAKSIIEQLFPSDMEVPLTKRELDIIKEIMKELPTKTIANNLNISEKTVEMHRSNIFMKLDVTNITGLVKKVIGLGIIEN